MKQDVNVRIIMNESGKKPLFTVEAYENGGARVICHLPENRLNGPGCFELNPGDTYDLLADWTFQD